MKSKWKCKNCQTVYYSEAGVKPPPINWSDGHKCELEKDEQFTKVEMLTDALQTIYEQCGDSKLDQNWLGWKVIEKLIPLKKNGNSSNN
jgi:hypothetical protein